MSRPLGFIGTGTITQSIVTGLCRRSEPPVEIWLSPRSLARARDLAAAYPNVRIAASNQEVLDRSEIVMLAVRPQNARSILEELRFRVTHLCISLIAGFSHETLRPLLDPASRCIRATPTPAVACGLGPIAVYPPDQEVSELFSHIGQPISVDDETQFNALLSCSAEMASFFRLLQCCRTFLCTHGLLDDSARRYVSSLFAALGQTALQHRELSFEQLAADHATPGGINEQLVRDLADAGVFAGHQLGLERVMSRLRAPQWVAAPSDGN